MSHPLRMCGLKYFDKTAPSLKATVTSFTDVWIEISELNNDVKGYAVTSFTDVWIEM